LEPQVLKSVRANVDSRRQPAGVRADRLRHWLFTAVGAGLCLSLGCSKQEPRSEYQIFSGTVKAADVETGELFVRFERSPQSGQTGRDIPCVATKDSEIYINDRFASVQDIVLGDAVELVGYRDADRFVVSFATIVRPEPPPPLPAIFRPATQPASQPTKE
jgi:hypothetical protein